MDQGASEQRVRVPPRPRVSIIVNNYNYARFLARSIDSALAQTYPGVEVIVVDDASTDGSRELIAGYGGRVKALLQPRNAGQGAAFNAGFAASSGEIVMFLDADDWLHPHAAGRVVSAWQPALCKVHFRLDLVDGEGRVIDVHPPGELRLDDGDVLPLLLETGRYLTPVTTGNAFSRRALAQVMPVPEATYRICADGYLATVVPFHGPVATLEERLGAYRLHDANGFVYGNAKKDRDGLLGRLHKALRHDMDKHRSLREEAARRGHTASPTLGHLDSAHLEGRLASLRLDRAAHPYPGDSALGLCLDGCRSLRYSGYSRRRQAVLAAWFLSVALLPRRWAATAIFWRLVQASRPPSVQRWLQGVRRAAG